MTAWRILGAVALVGANAFFVAAEFALVAARHARIDQMASAGSRRAVLVQKAMSELNLLLSGCQLGITFASLGLGWIGEPAFAGLLEGLFGGLEPPFDVIARHSVASILAFAAITLLHVVLGELVPKNLAIAAPEAVALWVAFPMRLFTSLFRPLIWLFNEGSNILVRLVGVEPQTELRAAHTLDELRLMLSEARDAGSIDSGQGEIVERTFGFPDKRARDVMVRRSDVQAVSAEAGISDVFELARQTGHTRFPVFVDSPGEFFGVVHLADMLRAEDQAPGARVRDAMHEPLVVPDFLHLDVLLSRMSEGRTHFAVVLDEFGSTEGIVTRDDVVAELVGDIADEHREVEAGPKRVGNGYVVDGAIHPGDLKRTTGIALPEGQYETLAGYITNELGRIAQTGDEIIGAGWRMRVAAVRRRRITSVELKPLGDA